MALTSKIGCGKLAIVVAGAFAIMSVQAVENAPLAAGMTAVRMLDFSGGAEQFKASLAALEAGTPEWERAMLGYAVCLHRRQPDMKADKEKAGASYDNVIARNSGSVYYQMALLFRGQLAERVDYFGDKGEPDLAVGYYGRLLDESPDSALAPYAALYRAQAQAFTMDAAQAQTAVDQLRAWIGKHPANPLCALQWMLIADINYHPLGDYEAAVRALVAGEAAGLPSSVLVDQYWWKTANLARLAGDKPLARHCLGKILELETSAFKAVACDLLAEMGGAGGATAATNN